MPIFLAEYAGGFASQICICMIILTTGVSNGLISGFSAVSLPQMSDAARPDRILLTADQVSWFASIVSLSAAIGCLTCGPLCDHFGRRATLLFLNIPCLIGWILLATVTSTSPGIIAQLYCGRLLSGLSMGMSSVARIIYLAEIDTSNKNRNILLAWASTISPLGVLIVYILGAIFRDDNWQMIAVICGILPILSILLTWQYVPESPLWLISMNRPEEALISLKRLRGIRGRAEIPNAVRAEYDGMLELHERKKIELYGVPDRVESNNRGTIGDGVLRNGNPMSNFDGSIARPLIVKYIKESWASVLVTCRALRRKESMKALFIMSGLYFFQQISGYTVITFYAVDFLLKSGVSVDPYMATIFLGLITYLVGIPVTFMIMSIGRRPMMITSGAGMASCMICLGLNLQFNWFSSWFPLTALTAIVVFSILGFRNVPTAFMGEIFSLDIKGVAAGISICIAYIFAFVTVKLYPILMDLMESTGGIFYFYGACSVVGTLFVIAFQPETHNKSLEDIQLEMKGVKRTEVKEVTEVKELTEVKEVIEVKEVVQREEGLTGETKEVEIA